MRHLVRPLTAVVAMISLSQCKTAEKNATASPQWYSNMHRLSATHLKLIPLVEDSRKFNDPANQGVIRKQMEEMISAAANITHDEKAPAADPLITHSALTFHLELKRAKQTFDAGDLQWSRYALNRASGYCISCHTRADRGARDFNIAWKPDLTGLTAPMRVEFLLANRQYTSSLKEAKRLASDNQSPQEMPRAWALALDRTMAMLVRVQKDPVEAEKLASAVVENRAAPYYARSDAAAWLKDIREWKSEPRDRASGLERAVAIMKKVHPDGLDRGRARLVSDLRASNMLHEQLEQTTSPNYAEALLYSGLVAQKLGDLNQGFLDQYYFEACIRASPHSEIAEKCYDDLDRSIQTASPFLDMEPEIEWYRMNELRKLAEFKHFEEPAWKRRSWEYDLNEPGPDRRRGK